MFEHKALYHVFEARAGHEGVAWTTKLPVSMLQFANVYEQFVDLCEQLPENIFDA